MGHTAVQTSVAEGFLAMEATIRMARCRWFADGLGSGVVFWIDVPHVHVRTILPGPLRSYGVILAPDLVVQ